MELMRKGSRAARLSFGGKVSLVLWAAAGTAVPGWTEGRYAPVQAVPPPIQREFRAAWIASVSNIDWPSRRDLSPAQQRAELVAILDRAVQLRLNAVLLQIRPAADALYASKLEPWSEYLTGQMGRPPRPLYDPLAFAVEEAHRRGLELHAWFNPFRARHTSGRSPVAPDHISRKQPALVRAYGKQLWMDPGEPAVWEHTLNVVRDVVRRYDIDGVHIDDYFYPYQERDRSGKVMAFPDYPSWTKYRAAGGKLKRDDWRRQNVNTFVRRFYQAVKGIKPHVKVGISPFGIWRPGYPPQIKGHDAYAHLYADARLWMQEGWLDYCAPQLYWAIDAPGQSFSVLLDWWAQQNGKQRHLWPGISHTHPPNEILQQIETVRRQRDAHGQVHWSMRFLTADRPGITETLAGSAYRNAALVPASPWLDRIPPARPDLRAEANQEDVTAHWRTNGTESAFLWVLQSARRGSWQSEVFPAKTTRRTWPALARPDFISITAVDRCGNASSPFVLGWTPPGAPKK